VNQLLYSAILLAILSACSTETSHNTDNPAASVQPAPTLGTGIDLQYLDTNIRPQDDIYAYLNGKWLTSYEIPADKGRYGSFDKLSDQTDEQAKAIIDKLAKATNLDAEAKKIADLYNSFIDETAVEALGDKPIFPLFHRINALTDKAQLPALFAELTKAGISVPYDFDVEQDSRDSTKYAVYLAQSGLGLPDRDYYLKNDERFKQIRVKYQSHIEKLLSLAGINSAKTDAAAIIKFETALAQAQWTKVENRDPVKTYNKTAIKSLDKLTPGYKWQSYIQDIGVGNKVDYVIVSQPSYLKALSHILAETPLPVLKAYLKWHSVSDASPYLSKAFVDEHFAFYGTALRDIPKNQDRWKRGVRLVNSALGEAFGKLYVNEYFPPENKARMQALVKNLLEAYKRNIETLEWMSPETKVGAREKLAKLVPKIGYPDQWRDYSTLNIVKGDLLGNVQRATRFEFERTLAKLGKPIDRNEWGMTPQTVNAYYNPQLNEIVFPAAILQPPFFNAKADDAVNYGGIGGVIGHEISHGFDDEGSQFDADGNLHDWFSKADHDKFAEKTKALVEQYNQYTPVPGYNVNGELTLGENIADNSGLAIAYKAYKISLNGDKSPVIEGLTGEQRLFLGWAQVWRSKSRENETVVRIKSDPHSPAEIRGLAPLLNQPGFYEAFDVKSGDKMYLAPDKRVIIW
jgi:predicted metalloendopeptidase